MGKPIDPRIAPDKTCDVWRCKRVDDSGETLEVGERLPWADEGESPRVEFVVDELTPEEIVRRWGPGKYRVEFYDVIEGRRLTKAHSGTLDITKDGDHVQVVRLKPPSRRSPVQLPSEVSGESAAIPGQQSPASTVQGAPATAPTRFFGEPARVPPPAPVPATPPAPSGNDPFALFAWIESVRSQERAYFAQELERRERMIRAEAEAYVQTHRAMADQQVSNARAFYQEMARLRSSANEERAQALDADTIREIVAEAVEDAMPDDEEDDEPSPIIPNAESDTAKAINSIVELAKPFLPILAERLQNGAASAPALSPKQGV